MEIRTAAPDFRCGYVTIIGEPNVGKSTLLNALLRQKISIVTDKPQTTRHRILGITSCDAYQAIFLDTPGIIKPKYLLHEVMMQFASLAIADADVLLFMIDATKPSVSPAMTHAEAFAGLRDLRKPVYLIINKIDLVNKAELLPMIEFYARRFPFREIFPIAAIRRDGTDALLAAVVRDLPTHPPLYPLDIVSEQSERFFVSEIIREKIFVRCHEEIPYSTTVDVVEFRERDGASPRGKGEKIFIAADLYVERESQKGILIGKKGAMLKEIGSMARKDIERFLDQPVFLELHVKVRDRWREDGKWLGRLGYR